MHEISQYINLVAFRGQNMKGLFISNLDSLVTLIVDIEYIFVAQ